MIILDTEGEEFVRENSFDIAIPIHVEQNHGETKIFAYPTVSALGEEYEKRFSENLFSDTALDFLREGCKPFCRELGYSEEKHPKNWGYNFICAHNAPCPDIPCERIRRDGKYKNLTTFDIGSCLAYERVIFAVVKEGQIVSVAVTCEAPGKEHDLVEIGTETAVGYRGNGYAQATVRALSAFLCEKGYRVLYKCHHENLASTAVARGADFEEVGRFFYYVLRKD
ncbi:MAG: GNAT family N-acetyltransferase [Clostridia bacterium]|nr:GNAT family N-acetyltransferase [Clostridia bacterium]